jgi:phosphonate transport system substrate-binding protein
MRILAALTIFYWTLAAGCPATEPAIQPPPAGTVFRLAKIPFMGVRDLYRDYQPFLENLAGRLGASRATLVLAADYEGAVKHLQAGEADCAWLGTLAYAQARVQGIPLVPLVCPVRPQGTSYRGLIIAAKDSNLRKLGDLKGKRFGFVDPDSASGYLFPKLMLEAAGIKVPRQLKTAQPGKPDFVGNHSNVVLNVLLGRYDAGAVHEGAIEEALAHDPARAAKLAIIAHTQPIFGEPIVVLSSTPEARRKQIREAFLAIRGPVAGVQVLKGVLGFSSVRDSDYDYVRKLVAKASRTGR